MEKYSNLFRSITKLVESGLISSKDLKKEIENALKFKIEDIINKLNLVSRDEFEIQKKLVNNLQKEILKLKKKRNKK